MEWLAKIADDAPAAALLLTAILVLSLLGLYKMPGIIARNVLRPHGLAQRGDWYTLVTSGFIHADLTHLLFNGLTFLAFGFSLERSIGTLLFVVLYAAGLIASSVATWLIHRGNPAYASLGASGAINAVLFAAIFMFPSMSIYAFPLPIPIPAPIFAVAYLAFSVFGSTSQLGRVNHDAHLAGALAGILFILVSEPGAFDQALAVWFG